MDHSDIIYLINELRFTMDRKNFEAEFSEWEEVYNFVSDFETNLCEAACEIDPEGVLESDEIAIIFDNKCSCNEMFCGKDEPQQINDDSIDVNSPDIKVSKYIGPKKIDY